MPYKTLIQHQNVFDHGLSLFLFVFFPYRSVDSPRHEPHQDLEFGGSTSLAIEPKEQPARRPVDRDTDHTISY